MLEWLLKVRLRWKIWSTPLPISNVDIVNWISLYYNSNIKNSNFPIMCSVNLTNLKKSSCSNSLSSKSGFPKKTFLKTTWHDMAFWLELESSTTTATQKYGIISPLYSGFPTAELFCRAEHLEDSIVLSSIVVHLTQGVRVCVCVWLWRCFLLLEPYLLPYPLDPLHLQEGVEEEFLKSQPMSQCLYNNEAKKLVE